MAPTSGLAFLLLSGALYFQLRAPARAWAYVCGVATLVTLWGLLGLVERVAGYSPGVEEILIGNRGYVGDFRSATFRVGTRPIAAGEYMRRSLIGLAAAAGIGLAAARLARRPPAPQTATGD